MVRRGEEWGAATDRDAETVVRGGDDALAAAAGDRPGTVVAWEPTGTAGLALTLGLGSGPSTAAPRLVAVDLLRVGLDGRPRVAVNAVVLGRSPARLAWRDPARRVVVEVDGRRVWQGRAGSVVVANGQYVDGADLVPRGHPGDGRFEIQVYGVRRAERAELRRRVEQGAHLPHPDIVQRSGRRATVRFARRAPVVVDGVAAGRAHEVEVAVDPGALHLLTGRAPSADSP